MTPTWMVTGAELLLSVVLGIVFLASALPKLRHPKGFVLTVLMYRVLPPSAGRVFAWLVPPTEFFSALLLLTGSSVRLAAAIVALLLLSFIVAVTVNIRRGLDLDCQCFGRRSRRRIGWPLVVEDALLLVLAVTLVAAIPSWLALAPWSVFSLVASLLPFTSTQPHMVDVGALCACMGCLLITVGTSALLRPSMKSYSQDPSLGKQPSTPVRMSAPFDGADRQIGIA